MYTKTESKDALGHTVVTVTSDSVEHEWVDAPEERQEAWRRSSPLLAFASPARQAEIRDQLSRAKIQLCAHCGYAYRLVATWEKRARQVAPGD